MDKEIIEVPVLSAAIRNMGIPLSPVVKANGFVFVSGQIALDPQTGEFAGTDVRQQTEPYNEKLDPQKDRQIDEMLAKAIQEVVWGVVSRHPLAGVRTTPVR